MNIDVGAVTIGKEFFDSGIQLQIRADKDDSFLGGFDDFFDEVINAAGGEKLRHEPKRSTLQTSEPCYMALRLLAAHASFLKKISA